MTMLVKSVGADRSSSVSKNGRTCRRWLNGAFLRNRGADDERGMTHLCESVSEYLQQVPTASCEKDDENHSRIGRMARRDGQGTKRNRRRRSNIRLIWL